MRNIYKITPSVYIHSCDLCLYAVFYHLIMATYNHKLHNMTFAHMCIVAQWGRELGMDCSTIILGLFGFHSAQVERCKVGGF